MKINFAQKIVLTLFAIFTVYWLILLIKGMKFGLSNDLYTLDNVIPFFAGIVAMRGAFVWKLKGSVGKGVFLLGLGIFFWSCGSIVWAYYNFFQGILAPYPSFADFFYLPSAFLYCAGTIYLSRAAGADFGLRHNKYFKAALIAVPIAVFILLYYSLIFSLRDTNFAQSDSMLKKFLDVLYPLGDLFSLTTSVLISGLYFKYLLKEYRIAASSILFGLVFMFAGDFYFSYLTTVEKYYNGGPSDFIFSIGLTLLAFGVLGFCGRKQEEGLKQENLHIFNYLKY